MDAVPPPPFGLMGVGDDPCVSRRRRCPCIASSSFLDLAPQDLSANVMLFLGRDTRTLAKTESWKVYWISHECEDQRQAGSTAS